MKKKIITVAQVSITIGILCWIFRDPEFRAKVITALGKVNIGWLLVALTLAVVPPLTGVVRWFTLLKVQGFELSFKRVAAIAWIGYYFNLFLFGATGGDVPKAWYLFQEAPKRKTVGLLTIVMDRLIGLVALIAISLVIISLRYQWLTRSPFAEKSLWALIFLLAGSISAIVVSLLITGFKLQHKLPKRLPGRESLIELASAYDLYAKRPLALAFTFLISAFSHFAVFTLYYCVAQAFGAGVQYWDMVAVMPMILVISSLPISVGGFGIRDGLFIGILGPLCGVPSEIAVLISTIGFFCSQLVWSILGGIVFMLYKPSSGQASIGEMQAETEKIEHKITDEN